MIHPKITKWSLIEVVFWSLMIGLGESYIAAYALACGLSERYAGLITTLPLGIASIFQLFSGQILRVVKSRRWLVMTFAFAQALTLFLISGHALFDRNSPILLMFVLTFYWFFGLSAGPIWNAWIVAIIPKDYRARFFSQRGPYHEISVLLGLALTGMLLSRTPDPVITFSFMFIAAGLCRMISAYSMFRLPEEPSIGGIQMPTPMDFKAFLSWIQKRNVLWMICLLGFFNLGVSIGSPFFSPYMLKRIQLDYESYMMLVATPFISRAIAYPFFEKIVLKFGVKKILLPSMIYISFMPVLWGYFPFLGTLMIFQIFAGIAWTGFEYSILLKQLSDFSQTERSRVLTWTNLIVGMCNIVGVIIGSQILGSKPQSTNYVTLFELSTIFRILPIFVVFAIDWEVSSRYINKLYMRFVGVRANRGAVTKPILYIDDNTEK